MKITTETAIDIQEIEAQYKAFILNGQHPCIMAKAIFKMEKYELQMYDDMKDSASLKTLLEDLKNYVSRYDFEDSSFETFLAVFPHNHFFDEVSFEKHLWQTLQNLSDLDNSDWDPKVSDNPDDPFFSFSLNGRAFYIIGMHPASSRLARQSPYTTLVFNLHSQFDKLREIGTYKMVRDTIRKNDQLLQGHINPVLKDFGDASESRQYSGREVEKDWKCPFHKH